MANRIRLRLTGISKKLTEEAEKRLDESQESILEPVCDSGHSLEYYETIGFPQHKIPKELIERQKDFELGIELNDEDYEEVISQVVLYEDEISLITEDVENNNTILYLRNLIKLSVKEKPFEIDELIEKLNKT